MSNESTISLIGQWKKENKPLWFPPSLPSGKPWPTISIITPSFNQGKFIEDTILSVRLQGYPHVEHIIVDGGSSDATLQVVDRHRDTLARVISEPDKGQSDAINKGMRLASGEIVTWLNSDDLLAPGALAAIAMAFDVNDADLVAGLCKLYMDGRHFATHMTSCPNGPLQFRQLLDMEHYWQAGMFFYQPEVMFSRKLWDMAGGYVDENLQFCMDGELFLRFSKFAPKLQVIGHPVAWFRYHKEQKTNNPHAAPNELKRVCEQAAREAQIDLAANNDPGPTLIGRSLQIAMVNDIGFQYGAGIAHRRLSDALTMAGHSVAHFTLGFFNGKSRAEGRKQLLRVTSEVDALRPDLVICGNLHGFSSEPDFLVEALSRWPVVLCVHDLWALTGRCPYPFACIEYRHGCTTQCPTYNEYPVLEKGLVPEAWGRKREALNRSRALLLCNSEWTLGVVKETLTGAELQCKRIAMGVDACFFANHPKHEAREYFQLPHDKFIILLASINISEKRKGREALELFDTLHDDAVMVVSLGVVNSEFQERYPWLTQIGLLDDPESISMAYAAADIHVSFSRAETFGQCFVEAAAAGTPSLGYRATGMNDSVTDGVTGRLVDLGEDLLVVLNKLMQDQGYRAALSTWATIHAENTRSLFLEYHSFYQALRESGLVGMDILGRKIGFLSEPYKFAELSAPLLDVQMAPYLGAGWSAISPKGILSTGKRSYINFTVTQPPQRLCIEVSAHWSVCSSLLVRMGALGFYMLMRGESGRLPSRLKRVFMAKRTPLAVGVFINKSKIGEFSLSSTRRIEMHFHVPHSVVERCNILMFDTVGGVFLSELGVSSQSQEFGFRLHRLALE